MARPASPLPSPASANSSSTLIVTPLALLAKGSPSAPMSIALPPSALDAAATDPHADAPPAPREHPAPAPTPRFPPGGAPALALRLASRASAPQTRMSERGFVEPHHSNVPRRTRTRAATHTHTRAHIPTSSPAQIHTPGGSPTSPAHPLPRRLALQPLSVYTPGAQDPDDDIAQPTTPRDTPNPNASRMPEHLLSLRLPPTPTDGPAAPSPRPASPGLPPASRILTAPRAGLPQGIGLGLGTPGPPTAGGAIVPGATPATPGSARLPTRRRRIAPDTGTPTQAGRGSGYAAKARESDAEDERGRASPALLVVPPRAPSSEGGIAHGPPSFRAHRARARAAAADARGARRARACVQRVGRASGVEVAFADGPGVVWDEFEEVALGAEVEAGDARTKNDEGEHRGLFVRIHTVESDEESESDWSSSSASGSVSGSVSRRRSDAQGKEKEKEREKDKETARELVLALPADRAALEDGACALSAAQLREACVFIARVRGAASSPAATAGAAQHSGRPAGGAGTAGEGAAGEAGRAEGGGAPRVRIVAPRGRAEDAMGVALAYLAYGPAVVAAAAAAAGEAGDTTAPGPTAARPSSAVFAPGPSTPQDDGTSGSSPASIPDPTATVAVGASNGPLPGTARLIEQTARAAGLGAMAGGEGAVLDALLDREGGVRAPSLAEEAELQEKDAEVQAHDAELDEAYTPAHRLTMRLLDEGEWLARGRPSSARGVGGVGAGGAGDGSGDGGGGGGGTGVLGAGRGVVGVVDLQRPGRGGLEFALGEEEGVDEDEDGEDDEEEEEDEEGYGEADEEGTAGSTAGSAPASASTSRSRSSAGAHVDTGSGASGEARRGRTVAWHGVPMPPKYGGEASASSVRTPARGEEKSKSRRRGDKSKSKSKSRVRGRPKSALPRGPSDAREDGEEDEQAEAAHARRAKERHARRRARRARRAQAAEEAYAGLADAWRGVLSHAGLARLAGVLAVR
ncbi:hypothetical protein HYPSUDRAFT_416413 [Hypholoma sublateritium FD-334 SS-4]|uniref:Uncharacterized protein n=1 Tax=Hypholoma sublateritium (strain FD-334 SS-4) TaxID=945553 RepID=A0A0D2P2L7_HYPSF|nr:hypothetical protein HYPSUDRAFT_416413 [Hypholoma sublateritium FD-334 SS-4]